MKLIVGLGNPGEKYQSTRHNLGFVVVEKLVKNLLPVDVSESVWKDNRKLSAQICKIGSGLLIVKPQTFMNNSGVSVKRIIDYYKIKLADVWVVHDDIDLPLGKIRIRKGGGSAGHNGIESIISMLKNDGFVRIRLGIGRGKLAISKATNVNLHRREIEKYVLSRFKDKEVSELKKLIKKTSQALKLALDEGIEKAMSRFN